MKYKVGQHPPEGFFPGEVVEISRQRARELDVTQKRRRIYHSEYDALISVMAGLSLVQNNIDGIKALAKSKRPEVPGKDGCGPKSANDWSMLRAGCSMILKAVNSITTAVNVEQICSVQHQTADCYISIQQTPKPGNIILTQEEVNSLFQNARTRCQDCIEFSSRKDWQKCELCKLLDTIPAAVDSKTEESRVANGICPYWMEEI